MCRCYRGRGRVWRCVTATRRPSLRRGSSVPKRHLRRHLRQRWTLCSKINLIGFENSFCGVNCPPRFPLLYLRPWVLRIATIIVLFLGTVSGIAVTTQGRDAPAEVPAVQHARTRFVLTLQDLAERFSNYIDALALQFSVVLVRWMQAPAAFGNCGGGESEASCHQDGRSGAGQIHGD